MTEKEIIREAMKRRGWSQAMLAEKSGFKSQSNITGLLNNSDRGMRMDKFYKLCKGLGLRIVVLDEYNLKDAGWVLEMQDPDDMRDQSDGGVQR